MRTETAFSTHTSRWRATEQEVKGKIMKTDVFIKLFSDRYSEEEMTQGIASGLQMFYAFEAQFSRFAKESELSRFNRGETSAVSKELFLLLKECARYHELTGKIFDPSVLPILERIGYKGKSALQVSSETNSFAELIFDDVHQTVQKPSGLSIDLGGIGKGYIVDKVADQLSKKYVDGIVDAGGDMRIFGGDREQNLDTFAIDVENPSDALQTLTTLSLTDCAVATSGTNRRKWKLGGKYYHHIINPLQKTSAETDVVQVTVIASRATEADVFAKTLLILGLERGLKFAEEKSIAALFVTADKKNICNALFQKYEWKI